MITPNNQNVAFGLNLQMCTCIVVQRMNKMDGHYIKVFLAVMMGCISGLIFVLSVIVLVVFFLKMIDLNQQNYIQDSRNEIH